MDAGQIVLAVGAGLGLAVGAWLFCRPRTWWHGRRCHFRNVPALILSTWISALFGYLLGAAPQYEHLLAAAVACVPFLSVVVLGRPRILMPPGSVDDDV